MQTSGERAPKKRLLCDPWLRPRALRLVSGPRRRSGRSVIDREMAYVLFVKGYCHGLRKDRGNEYTASDELGVFADSPETGQSRNTPERGGSKGDRLKVAISLLGALGTYIHGTQRKCSNLTNIRTRLYHTVTLANIFAPSVQSVI